MAASPACSACCSRSAGCRARWRSAAASRCRPQARRVPCEVVGFRAGRALLMPFGALDGIGLGCKVEPMPGADAIYPHDGWLGRVINAFGEPIDGKGPLPRGAHRLSAAQPPAAGACAPARVQGKIDLGVRALNTFLTCCRGQRMGIFAGSGVGKSVLMSMIARYTAADATVIGLVGERGREVQEFIEDDLGPEGLARSIVVVATSDELPLMRRQAAYLTLPSPNSCATASATCSASSTASRASPRRSARSASAAGEPPTTKGYTPTVFAELPKLLERAGPGHRQGQHHRPLHRAGRGRRPATSRSPTPAARSSTGISCSTARSPSAAAIPRSMCCARSRASMPQCNTEAENRARRRGAAATSRPTRTWPS